MLLIIVSAKAIIRICPQMSQMNTDEEKHLCSSVTSVDQFSDPGHRRKLTGTMIKAKTTTTLVRNVFP